MPAVCENTTGQAELRREGPSMPVPPGGRPRRFPRWIICAVPVASLFGTAWVVWFAALVPRLDRLPPGVLIAEALEYALLAWAWGAAITLGLFLLIPRPARFDAVAFTLRTSATAVWFAPAMLALSASSLGSLAAGTILIASITRTLYVHWLAIYGAAPQHTESPAWGPSPPALAISLTLQSGTLCVLMGRSLQAAALWGTGAALFTWFATRDGAWPLRASPGLSRSVASVLLTVMLSATLTVASLSRRLLVSPETRWDTQSEPRPGLAESVRKLLDPILYGDESSPPAVAAPVYQPPPFPASGDIQDTSFPGVVIWPEVKAHTILVPPLPAIGFGLPGLTRQPLSIPFAGEYWLFKPPDARPPLQSLLRRGTPLDLGYVTTDHRPMWMEAHHRFDQPIDLRCCSQIRLQISNADRYPGTVALELILINSMQRPQRWVSAGKLPVTSRPLLPPPWRGGAALPSPEMLAFAIPPHPALRQFNEIKVVFHRDRMRNERSARIAIERIIFVP